jgi:hypothetical protein
MRLRKCLALTGVSMEFIALTTLEALNKNNFLFYKKTNIYVCARIQKPVIVRTWNVR